MDWEAAVRAVPLIAGAAYSLYRFRDLNPRLRSKLKSDVEILTKLDPDSKAYATLKSNVEIAVEKLYPSSEQHEQKVVVSDVAFGVIFLVGFGFWTAHLVSDGFSYWALLTGFFAVTGVGLLLLGFGYGSTLPGETAGAARQRGARQQNAEPREDRRTPAERRDP